MPETTELRVEGMDCAECAVDVEKALLKVTGVEKVETYPMSLKAKVVHDAQSAPASVIRAAIEGAGYRVMASQEPLDSGAGNVLGMRMGFVLAGVFALVLAVVVGGEATGLLDRLTAAVPWYVGALLVLAAGATIFWQVLRDAVRLRATARTLMSVGAIAALAVGSWVTSLIVVAFMRIGERIEDYTTDKARDALRNLTRMAPQTARLLDGERERVVPIAQVKVGDRVLVRPGERIPVDGQVLQGTATVDESAVTGESMPKDVQAGDAVRAATLAGLGSIQVKAERVGEDTTFGRIVKLVEDTEAHRAQVQRFADRFTNVFLPLVVTVAVLTFIVRRDVLASAAVLVVACSCSVALATPIAVLAATGSSARRGLLVKGGKHLERLVKADTLLVDKTGTLTQGRPTLTDLVPLDHRSEADLLRLVASAERDSEHPLARAVLTAAHQRNLPLSRPASFRALPGTGLEAEVEGRSVRIGKAGPDTPEAHRLRQQGKTVVEVAIDGKRAALLAFQDALRPDASEALDQLRHREHFQRIEMLTGDNEETAKAIAGQLGIAFRANLLPEDKIRVVRDHQAQGRVVVMVGDGVNDAPALAQADVGIAMHGGTDVAMDAAHVILMRDDWSLVPLAFHKAHRTMRVIRFNLLFTAGFNLVGMSLAAIGIVPLVYAAALQSIPDVGILGNSMTLLRDRPSEAHRANRTEAAEHAPGPGKVQDPVCKCWVDPKATRWHTSHAGREYHFCAEGCKDTFDATPGQYAGKA